MIRLEPLLSKPLQPEEQPDLDLMAKEKLLKTQIQIRAIMSLMNSRESRIIIIQRDSLQVNSKTKHLTSVNIKGLMIKLITASISRLEINSTIRTIRTNRIYTNEFYEINKNKFVHT